MPQALTAFLLLFTFLGVSMVATGTRTEFASANRQSFVELSKTPENKILVTVFHLTNEVKTLHWSRAVNWEGRDPSSTSRNLSEVKALVTNDGNTVVLRDYNTLRAMNGIRVIRREHSEDKIFAPFQEQTFDTTKPRPGASYLEVGSLLDFIFEDQNSYALWFGQTDRWLLISLQNFTETVVQDPDTLNSLNKTAHAKAKELVLQHQPPPLRRMLGALKDRVVRFAPSLGSPTSPRFMRGETAAAYLFLTARQHPSDKAFIEGLVKFPPHGIQNTDGRVNPRLNVKFLVAYPERLVGDFLLGRWNGDTNRELIAQEMSLLIPQVKLRYLGTIRINVTFPIDVPTTNSGLLWIYLTPPNVTPAEWAESDDLLTFSGFLNFPRIYVNHSNPQPLGREGQVTISGLTPGDYRAKIIWDRKGLTGTGGLWRNIHTGVAGDYESTQTPPITVKAGELIENIHLAVTNLIGPTQAP